MLFPILLNRIYITTMGVGIGGQGAYPLPGFSYTVQM